MKSMKLIRTALALCFGVTMMARPGQATTFVVFNTQDSGPGSLRQAISDANANGGGDVTFSNVTGTISLTNGQLTISQPGVNIIGPGPANLVISGTTNGVFYIGSSASSLFSGLSIENGSPQRSGGGIYNIGNLALNNCVVANNSAGHYSTNNTCGGGIYNGGTLTLTNCVVTNNCVYSFVAIETFYVSGLGNGGGVFNQGTLILYQSVVSSNQCATINGDRGTMDGGSGGGIYNSNSATIILSTIAGNSAGNGSYYGDESPPGNGGVGGGIFNSGTLVIDRTTISGNAGGSVHSTEMPGASGGSGAGIWNSGQLTMTCSTISSNSCGNGGNAMTYMNSSYSAGPGGGGGGVYNAGVAGLTNCTIFGNTSGNGGNGYNGGAAPCNGGSGGNGGGILNQGIVSLNNCTVESNVAGNYGPGSPSEYGDPAGTNGVAGVGGGIYQGASAGQVINTLISSNSAGGGGTDVSGSFISLGFNLIGNTNGSSGFGATGDLISLNPLLGQLGNYGGPTQTIPLLPGSPAIDAADPSSFPATDQRGFARPYGLAPDIGAFEYSPIAPFSPNSQMTTNGFQFQVTSVNGTGPIVIYASTDLIAWKPILTNSQCVGTVSFIDTNATNLPGCFYKATEQ
jgi:hypothetical protein